MKLILLACPIFAQQFEVASIRPFDPNVPGQAVVLQLRRCAAEGRRPVAAGLPGHPVNVQSGPEIIVALNR
jgi:hypothetical protein